MNTKLFAPVSCILLLAVLLASAVTAPFSACADSTGGYQGDAAVNTMGGGYAATGQTENMGYMSKLYDVTNGLITSDANFILCASSGYVWIGGYCGILRYDGSAFTKLDTADGLTSGRALFEDSRHYIWVGTNDNGVVMLAGNERIHYTQQEGMPASSVRSFAEDREGNVFIGTTAGVCYVDPTMKLHPLEDDRLNGERILRLDSDAEGRIYGHTKSGSIFLIENKQLSAIYSSEALQTEKITTIMADPLHAGNVYLGTNGSAIYYGEFGCKAGAMKRISVEPLFDIHWLSYDCGRLWVSSTTAAGYLDESEHIHMLDDIPMNSGIEMTTSDYQGNMWFASSRQGVMKIVSSSFVDVSEKAELPAEVANAVCLHENRLYIGTDKGLQVLDRNGKQIKNALTDYIGEARIRSITTGTDGALWVGVFTNELGLVRMSKNGKITAFTKENGMPSDEIRCISLMKDGTVIAGTNDGLAMIRGDAVIRTVSSDDVQNTVVLDVEEGEHGEVYIGTDGDGIYVLNGTEIHHFSRDDGLTSDVVMRIKYDTKRNLYWLVTSNSVEYLQDGRITCVTTFPYNNNYDLYYGTNDDIWFISSCGIYVVNAEDLLCDDVSTYRLYTPANGLTSPPTSNGFCALHEDGTLYIPVRSGVCSVNIHTFAEGSIAVKAAIKSVYCGDTEILPDSTGKYILPATDKRIRINTAVFDYSLTNPQIQVYLEGKEKDGISTTMSALAPLEYTGLGYGQYKLHIRATDSASGRILLDNIYDFEKQPKLTERWDFRIAMLLLVVALAGFIVWRLARTIFMRQQYEELKRARNEAQIANKARTNFLASMSHELLTPINTIVGMNELTLREDTSGKAEEYAANIRNYAMDIRNASESLKYLVSDLLDMSDVESGRMHICIQEYDIAAALRDMAALTRSRCQEKDIDFTVNVEEMLPRRMSGDIGKIKHIIMNLLTNSVKYTDTGGIVLTVSLEEKAGTDCTLQFSVKDTGMGMNEAIIKNLFTVYDNIGEGGISSSINTGIALGISHQFAELMGGTLTCESEEGKGSEFILTLKQKIVDKTPIGVFFEDTENGMQQYAPLFKAPDADILVASSDTMLVKVIKGLLKATEVFVATASNIEECTDKMRSTKFHVILFDFMLSDAEGTFPQKLRERDENVPVYVITSYESADEVLYIGKGYTGCISKPIDGTTLEKKIMKHLPVNIMHIPDDVLTRR